ncbi:MAG: DUF177 domain-containing protein [Gammaproteobacteria bacterium]|nr:DUF177 domain-containing protein [Gammaproteobacteria bacterium]
MRRFDSSPGGPYHAPAMGNPLQHRRTPLELAASSQAFEIYEKLRNFERLFAIVEADLSALDPDRLPAAWQGASVQGELSFGFVDAQRSLPAVAGVVAVTIDAVCQRCLEPMQLPLQAELQYVFAAAGAVVASGGDYEVWDLEEETLRPLDVVEEALIMAMPLAALHVDDPSCQAPEAQAAEAGGRVRPFASLKAQLDKEN